jgi:Uncharacterised nucleotidyltransferase
MPRSRLALVSHLISITANGYNGEEQNYSCSEEELNWLASKRIDSLAYFAGSNNAPMQQLYDGVATIQFSALDTLLEQLQELQIPVILFKGGEISARWFNRRGLGFYNDLDLLVPSASLARIKRHLIRSGYFQGVYDPIHHTLVDRDLGVVARIESTHYELAPFNKLQPMHGSPVALSLAAAWKQHPLWVEEGRCRVVVEFDIHNQVALDISSPPLFQRAVPSAVSGALTLSPADHLWFTLSRYYNEVGLHGKSSLRDLVFAAMILRSDNLDWEVVLRNVCDLDIRPSVYYWLRFLADLIPTSVPNEVLSALDPRNGSRSRDWGWQFGKLFDSLEEVPALAERL